MYSPQRWQRIVTPASGMRRFYKAPRIESNRLILMIPAIILAAGKSSRMGRTKALLPVGAGETFLSRLARILKEGGADDVIVVVGADAGAIRAAIARDSIEVRPVDNPDWERGQLTSLLAGLRAVDRPGVRAALVALIDVPLVSADTVRALIQEYTAGSNLIVRPGAGARHGHPVIFDRALFGEFRAADIREGAKSVVRAYAAETLNLEIDDEGAFIDIDTPAEYERLIGEFPNTS